MNIERATYSYNKVTECINTLKAFNITTTTKKDHYNKVLEVKRLFDLFYDNTNCCLFETNNSYWSDYCKAFDNKYTKKELDKLLKQCINFLRHEIGEIYIMMELGEVNAVA